MLRNKMERRKKLYLLSNVLIARLFEKGKTDNIEKEIEEFRNGSRMNKQQLCKESKNRTKTEMKTACGPV